MKPVPLVACGIFKAEFAALDAELRERFNPVFLESMLHMDPDRLDQALAAALPPAGEPAVILYGDCSPHMGEFGEAPARVRTEGDNCCEICLGRDRYRQLRRSKAFFLMHEWALRWERVFKTELGFVSRETARAYMGETMKEAVYLDCGSSPIPEPVLAEASDYLGLPLRVEACGLGHLDAALRAALGKLAPRDAEEDRAARHDEAAFAMMSSDLVERLLSLAEKPSGSSDFIAEELRALVGARTVLVFQCSAAAPDGRHQLVSAFPRRRQAVAEDPLVERLLELSHGFERSRIVDGRDGSPEAELLAGLGSELSMVIPLAFGGHREGAIILLEILDRGTVDKIIPPLQRLSSILALVLRNAYLYAHLEDEVAKRTRDLEVRSRELERSLAEKDALLKEVHHRVKNNLQIVISLLYLQSSTTDDAVAKEALEDSQARIQAMALVHEELYRSQDLQHVDLAEYLPRLCSSILDPLCPDATMDIVTEPLWLSPGLAIPCGLILSELVMNSAKHAFASRGGGRLSLRVARSGAEALVELEDDGPGMSAEGRRLFRAAGAVGEGEARSIGLSIAMTLADQLHGRLELADPGGEGRGARISLRFPLHSATIS
jgi:two-component sensor histidine kinase